MLHISPVALAPMDSERGVVEGENLKPKQGPQATPDLALTFFRLDALTSVAPKKTNEAPKVVRRMSTIARPPIEGKEGGIASVQTKADEVALVITTMGIMNSSQ